MAKLNKGTSKYPLARTMSEFIYTELKESIINNELKANQRINEKEIVEYFQVSRTPIREAILRLEAKGFVKIDSYRRAVVKEISYKELMEIFQVLGALDRLAVSQAVDNLTPQNLNKLESFVEKMEKYCSLDSIEKYFEFNEKFHNEIWKAVENRLLLEVLDSVRDRMQRYTYARISAFKKPEALEKSLKQHKALLTALKQAADERDNPTLEMETMVIAPHMLSKECYEENCDRYSKGHYPYWDDRWRGGIDSENSPQISNFACLDKMILEIHQNCPNIKVFVFVGHSAGGQIVNRYALSNTVHDSLVTDGCHVRYVLANPSSFVYLDDYRPDLDKESGFIRITQDPCDSVAYNDWKYGINNIYPYPASTSVTTMIEKFRNREVIVLLGTKDNDPNHEGLDKKCAGMLQGRHRLERGLRYYEYLGFFYGKDVYSTKFLALVSGVGHHGGDMFQSDVGKYWIFFPE